MSNRKWISREEIAQIHESIATNALHNISTLHPESPVYVKGVAEFINHRKTAADIRYTDSLRGGYR